MENQQPAPSPVQPASPQKKGYGKKPLWFWILLYVVIGAIVYGGIYYFVFAKSDGYSSTNNGNTNTTRTYGY